MLIPDLSPLWISFKVSLLATLITAILGTVTAYKMYGCRSREKSAVANSLRSIVNSILIAPLILPPTVVGFILLMLLGKNSGFGQVLALWNLRFIFTWYAAVVAAVIISFPLMYRAALGAFEQIDKVLLDAARVEGASEKAVFWFIALPLALPGLLGGTMLAFARALGEFGATLMLAGNIPGQTQTMPMAVYFAVEAGAIEEGWFWAIALMSVSLVGVFLIDRWKLN
jgi:molybdate ABC transporter permease protein